jgi:hypothetical protein
MTDHFEQKLKRDLLYAELNVHANEIARQLRDESLAAALKTLESWQLVQDEIDLLRDSLDAAEEDDE